MELKELLGDEASSLLAHECRTIPRERLQPPGPDFVDRVTAPSDRPPAVSRNMQHVFDTGRLAGTGYLSILPVDQGVEHSAAASFASRTGPTTTSALIVGRKSFQRPRDEGVALIHAVQDVYLDDTVTIA